MNSAATKILIAFGTVLLVGAVGMAQTDATSGSSSQAKKKHSTQTSTSSTQNSSNSYGTSTSESSAPASSATGSQSNSAQPQSDSTANSSGATDRQSVKAGNSGFDDNSGSSQTQPSQAAGTTYGVSTQSSASQSGSEASSSASAVSSGDISNGPVAETVTDSGALLGWSTRNAASNTGLKYGTNRASLSETAQGADGSDGKNHHVKLDRLSPNTRYYFQVTVNGQPVGGVGTFRTTAAGEQPVQSKAVIPQK